MPTTTGARSRADAGCDAFAFPPHGVFWKVCRERCSLLDGGAAAVLQVAHPKLAAGVRDHSDFRSGPVARLQRTLDGVNAIAFGTRAQASAVAARIAARHAVVRGRVAQDVLEPHNSSPHPQPAGEHTRAGDDPRYTAEDPELLMWVVATLVVAAVVGYERALPRLADAEKAEFYSEMRQFGTYFGLPESFGPQTWGEFLQYYDRMLADPQIGSTGVSRAMAWAVAAPRRPWWLRLASRPARFAVVEILPSPVRERLGFRRSWWTRFAMGAVSRLLPRVVPSLPPRLRFAPQYLEAVRTAITPFDRSHR